MADRKCAKYDIKVIQTDKSKIPQRTAAKDQVMPRFPFSMMITGSSGSGKTNLIINIMTDPELYGKYFHRIAIFSPTAGFDWTLIIRAYRTSLTYKGSTGHS